MNSESAIEDIRSRVESVERTLRGYNGTPGLVGELAIIKQVLSNIAAERKEDYEMRKNLADAVSTLHTEFEALKASICAERESKIDFRWLVERVLLPLLLPMIGTAVALAATLSRYSK